MPTRQVGEKCGQLLTRHLLAQHYLAVLIHTVDLKYLFGEIQANRSTVHDDAPFSQ